MDKKVTPPDINRLAFKSISIENNKETLCVPIKIKEYDNLEKLTGNDHKYEHYGVFGFLDAWSWSTFIALALGLLSSKASSTFLSSGSVLIGSIVTIVSILVCLFVIISKNKDKIDQDQYFDDNTIQHPQAIEIFKQFHTALYDNDLTIEQTPRTCAVYDAAIGSLTSQLEITDGRDNGITDWVYKSVIPDLEASTKKDAASANVNSQYGVEEIRRQYNTLTDFYDM